LNNKLKIYKEEYNTFIEENNRELDLHKEEKNELQKKLYEV